MTLGKILLSGVGAVALALSIVAGLAWWSLQPWEQPLALPDGLVAMSVPDDFMLVNYQREVLGQRRVGHISPVAAFDRESDSVLILDRATYNYPATWVPLSRLHAAMAVADPASGRARGFVEVSNVRG